jgi:hypothetical protein
MNNDNNQNNEEVQELPSTRETDRELSKAIIVSLDIEQNFKLYSYRIISPDEFIRRVSELTDFYKKAK